jgi:hydroxyacylglutathione hydrolase
MIREKCLPAVAAMLLSVTLATAALAQAAEPDGGAIRAGVLPAQWASGGPKCMEMPEWQVHEYNPDLYFLRQSGCTDYEKPFVFLLFGAERALLLDTGSRRGNIAPEIQLVVHRWLTRNNRSGIPLIVAHTHSHSDHVAGDAELLALNDAALPVTFVAATIEANQKFFGIARWPEDPGKLDLGDRVIDVLAIPGHDAAGVALYDRQTAILFTGDSVYPGRLYIRDLTAFTKSNQRMLNFTQGKLLAHLLGNHIEQSRTPYLDYPVGTRYQPLEHEWSLSRGVLFEIQAGLESMHGVAQRIAFRDFSLWPSGPQAPETDAARAAFKRTQEQQLDHMWDQTKP